MGYIDDPKYIRVDLFDLNYCYVKTISVFCDEYGATHIDKAFERALKVYFNNKKEDFCGFAVCLEPNHKEQIPLLLKCKFLIN